MHAVYTVGITTIIRLEWQPVNKTIAHFHASHYFSQHTLAYNFWCDSCAWGKSNSCEKLFPNQHTYDISCLKCRLWITQIYPIFVLYFFCHCKYIEASKLCYRLNSYHDFLYSSIGLFIAVGFSLKTVVSVWKPKWKTKYNSNFEMQNIKQKNIGCTVRIGKHTNQRANERTNERNQKYEKNK